MPGNINVRKGEPAQKWKNNQRKVAGTRTVGTGAKTWGMGNNIGMQQGDLVKEDDDGGEITTSTSTLNAKHPVAHANEKLEVVPPVTVESGSAASPALPSHPVGRGISLPFGQSLPRCAKCSCSALINKVDSFHPESNYVLCLDHGLLINSVTRDLVFPRTNSWPCLWSYRFISPEHEAAIRAFLA